MASRKSTPASSLRRCIGSARYGIEAHEAPETEFPRQPSQKDGLGRMCKPHWKQYTAGLARDARARKAASPPEPAAQPEVEPAAGRKLRRGRVRDATAEQQAEHAELERQIAEAGGTGTDAGQALLEAAADRAASLRVGRRTAKEVEPVAAEVDEAA